MYSVRMRASRDGSHISGSERIVEYSEIATTAQSLIDRAFSHEKGKPDFINLSFEELKTLIRGTTSLPLILTHVENVAEGRALARRLLLSLGIPLLCVENAIALLEKGAADGESMRGAIIMNMQGERLEPDKHRGVRASRMDIAVEASTQLAHVRIPHLKAEGNCSGGRVFFVGNIDLNNYIQEMEKAPVLVDKFGGLKELEKTGG